MPENRPRLTMQVLLTRIEALEAQMEAFTARDAAGRPPALQVLDVNMVPTAEEVEGARTLLDPAGPPRTVPARAGTQTACLDPDPPSGEADGSADQQAGAVVRRMLRAANVPFTQVRVRWEMNERRAAIYLDRDAVMDMLSDPDETGGRFLEIVEWGEAICHALAAGATGERQDVMKWFPYSRDDDAWWGAKVLIPHLGV